MTGWLGGERGRLGIGHANGRTYTAGFEFPISRPVSFTSSITYALTERFVIDPFVDEATRLSGPYDDDMLLIDAGLRFTITGGKSWHGFTAYASGALGMAISSGSPPDRGLYKFGKKVTLTPGAGLRFYPGGKLSVLVDGRVVAWRLTYPPDYFRAPSADVTPVLGPDDPDVDWTIHPLISVGLGWNF